MKCFKCGEENLKYEYDCFVVESAYRRRSKVSTPSMCDKCRKSFHKLYMNWFYEEGAVER